MNVYDFDGTIYKGDSTVDFYFYELSHNFKVLKAIPIQIKGFFNFLRGKISKTEFKQCFYTFLLYVDDIEWEISSFWKKYDAKIATWYLAQKQSDDLIISASPEFLLQPIAEQLCIKGVIASKVDMYTGECYGYNCYGKEKVVRLKEIQSVSDELNVEIENFYSDSNSDLPLARLAKRSYLVKGKKIKKWDFSN